jgi:hypothetical protein
MKASIEMIPGGNARLIIRPSNDTEAYALRCWMADYSNGGNNVLQVQTEILETEET